MTKFFIALLLATFCVVNQAVMAKTAGSEWVLKQNSLDLGPLNVFISDNAVKVECSRQGYCVLTKAPDWQVYCYNPVEKTIWVSTLDAFNGLLMSNPFSLSKYSSGSVRRVRETTYAGLKCVEFRPLDPKLWLMFTTDQISSNAKVCEFLNRYYYLPNSGQVPLYRKIEVLKNRRKITKDWLTADMSADLRNQPRVALTTVEAKKVELRPADFDIPQNFRRVHNVNDISLSKGHKEQINELVDSLGFTTNIAEPAKQKH